MINEKDFLGFDTKGKTKNELAEEAVNRATYIIANVRAFKAPRLAQIAKYRDLYANKTKKKFRQPFNVVLPVFSGTMDTLQAAFNDDLAMKFEPQEPADYMVANKIQALWDMEVTAVTSNAKFAFKSRCDRSNALFTGRGFLMDYAKSIPEYQNQFEVYELDDAIFQPQGGGHLENHLYAGRENIIRSASQLKDGTYDKVQVKELLGMCAATDYYPVDDTEISNYLAKFKASGLDVKSNDYVGETLFNLTEIILTMAGERFYLLFSPWYRKWLRFEKLTDISSAGLYPYVSWATHEDNKNFLTKSYADDIYGIAEHIHILTNQELTNREKRNNNARAFDTEIFSDVGKLDQAQLSRPGALVPANTKNGTRRISEGIYTFETPELKGTIDLIGWLQEEMGRDIGVTDLMMGGSQNVSKKATVILSEQQNISKRLLLRSSSYTEAMAEIGNLFIGGLKDHLPAKKAIKLIGDSASGWDEITRSDLDTFSNLDIKIVSSSMEMKNSLLKKEARLKTLNEISLNPTEAKEVNPKALVEEKLRSGGEFDDGEISILMDTKNYGNKEESSYAHKAIQDILLNKKPDLYYGATTLFIEIIYDYARNYKSKIGDKKYNALLEYNLKHDAIIKENIERQAMVQKTSQIQAQSMPAQPNTPQGNTATPATDILNNVPQQ